MKIVLKNIINKETKELELDMKEFNETYKYDSIDTFHSIEGEISITKISEIYHTEISFVAKMKLISSLSLTRFDDELKVEDVIDYVIGEEYESEEVIPTENELNVENLVYTLIVLNLPIQLYAPNDEALSGEGYRVVKEEDLEREESSPFDALDSLDLD